MKGLACLMRGKALNTFRKHYGNVNMVRRKDLRRLKKINIYNKQISGEQNSNTWFNPRKLKAMAQHIEGMKNNHIGANPIDPSIQKEMLKTIPEMADFQYWNFRNRQQQIVEFQATINNCGLDELISQLPAKIRLEINSAEQNPLPQVAAPLLKYTEQLQVYLPEDERHRYNLLLKLNHPPKVKLEDDES